MVGQGRGLLPGFSAPELEIPAKCKYLFLTGPASVPRLAGMFSVAAKQRCVCEDNILLPQWLSRKKKQHEPTEFLGFPSV